MTGVWLAGLALVGLLVAVTGCTDSAGRERDGLIDASSVKPGEPVFVHGTIEGTITADTDETIARGTRIEVSVQNSFNGVQVAWNYMHLEESASFPIPFEVECDPCRFYPNDSYVARAEIAFGGGDQLASHYLSGMDAPVIADDRLAKDVEIRVVESAIITGTQKVTFIFDADGLPPEVTYIRFSAVDPLTGHRVGYERFDPEEPTRLPVSLELKCAAPCAVHPHSEYVADVTMHDREGYQFNNSRATTVIADGKPATQVEIAMMPKPLISGTITFTGSDRLPDDVAGNTYLKDVSREGGEPKIVGQTLIHQGRSTDSPHGFSLHYHPTDINPNATYVLDLELRARGGANCHIAYTTRVAPRVLTQGAPSDDIQLEMIPVERPQSPTDNLPTVSGTVRIQDSPPDDRDPSSYWQFSLIDVTRDCVAAHLEMEELDLPYSFSLPYNPSEVNPDSLYVVSVFKSLESPSPGPGGTYVSLEGESEERFTFINGRPSTRDTDVTLSGWIMLAD